MGYYSVSAGHYPILSLCSAKVWNWVLRNQRGNEVGNGRGEELTGLRKSS